MINKKELNLFLKASQEIGKNFIFTQGAGGNTSYKDGDSLFIKGSGLKLKDSIKKDIFIEVNFKKIVRNLNIGNENPISGAWKESQDKKPSIETAMHALMPHKYIFHIHCLNTISLLVQENAEQKLANYFSDLKYSFIKYAMPGLSLSKEIQKILQNNKPDILFLGNHGLVVGSNSVSGAIKKINFVSKSIKTNFHKKLSLNNDLLHKIAFDTFYRPTKYLESNQLASKDEYINILTSGSLFPDQVVFLGPRIIKINDKSELINIYENFKTKNKFPITVIPKAGILVPKNITPESEELIFAIYLIISRIPKNEKINYLSESEENEITNSAEEKYRLKKNNII